MVRQFFFGALCSCLVLSGNCFAQDIGTSSSATLKKCAIRVRTIRGETLTTDATKRSVTAGPMLQDLTTHLETLPYEHYKILDVKEQPVPFGERVEFKLLGDKAQTYSLSVQPQSIVDKRIQLVVQWTGPQGESLLSTKLRVENGKNVVVGTDLEDDSSTMFCIRINCT